jgi:hypothetical protein
MRTHPTHGRQGRALWSISDGAGRSRRQMRGAAPRGLNYYGQKVQDVKQWGHQDNRHSTTKIPGGPSNQGQFRAFGRLSPHTPNSYAFGPITRHKKPHLSTEETSNCQISVSWFHVGLQFRGRLTQFESCELAHETTARNSLPPGLPLCAMRPVEARPSCGEMAFSRQVVLPRLGR